jgi:hypothetical protein
MRLKAYLVVGLLIFGCSPGGSQDKGKPDLSVSDARKIPPFPPKGVTVKKERKRILVTWDLVPLENITGYKVYRKVGDSEFEYVGTVERPPFIDKHPPSGASLYTVTAVNTYQAESSFAIPAKK